MLTLLFLKNLNLLRRSITSRMPDIRFWAEVFHRKCGVAQILHDPHPHPATILTEYPPAIGETAGKKN